MKKILSLLMALLLILFVLGCSEDEENPVNSNNPTVSGSWKGKATLMGIPVGYLDATLSQSGSSVSGSTIIYGTIVANDTLHCTVSSGNNNYPNVSFTSTAPAPGGMYSLTYTGTFVNSDSLSGTIKDDASGVSYPMGIKKQ
ncbi:MAG: hypothetical protein IH618_12435 [Ignavibacteriaceae bacterium]|nr:hypothetical protein [Ignavibacteriaceae bacterium]